MEQQELFTLEVPAPEFDIPGFSLQLDYIDAAEEAELLQHVDEGEWETDIRRRIQQYGLGYSAERGQAATWLRELPEWLFPLAARVQHESGMDRFPENCVINEYIPPLGIGPHRDYPAFGPTIACVSLGSDVIINFTLPERDLHIPVHVPRRSLWVTSGEARSQWRHGIAPRLTDVIHGNRQRRDRRVSITFRTAKNPALIPTREIPF